MRNLYLVGFMGAGKTAAGRVVAARLELRFVDLDEAIEERAGETIPEIFSTRGEAEFRRLETGELETTVKRADLVVATGGGAFSSQENRGMIHTSGGLSVFLDLPWKAIRSRLAGDQENRPKWVDENHARGLYETRRRDYRRASVHIGLEGRETPDEVAGRIEAALKETVCVS